MELIVYWTKFAENKLEDIYEYYLLKANIKIAKELVNGIIDTTIDLELNPNIGQNEELLSARPQGFKYLVYKNYKIIYWINVNKMRIEVVNVFDTRQNPRKINMTD